MQSIHSTGLVIILVTSLVAATVEKWLNDIQLCSAMHPLPGLEKPMIRICGIVRRVMGA